MPLDSPADASSIETAKAVFMSSRRRLFGIAYRMLGSVAEAEDIVQDAWIRWQTADRTTVLDPIAYLVSVVTRLSIDVAQSARVRRETYIGPWLPEPVDTRTDPTLGAERGEALHLAVMLLLEKLPSAERAAYILREAFDYSHRQIAEVLEISESNARQIVTRARKHIASERVSPASKSDHARLLQTFIAAAQQGELSGLERLLSSNAISYSDGGGVVRAASAPVHGRERIAKLIASFALHFWKDTTVTWIEANGAPAALIQREGRPYALASVETSGDVIDRILWVLNPAKLNAISTQSPSAQI